MEETASELNSMPLLDAPDFCLKPYTALPFRGRLERVQSRFAVMQERCCVVMNLLLMCTIFPVDLPALIREQVRNHSITVRKCARIAGGRPHVDSSQLSKQQRDPEQIQARRFNGEGFVEILQCPLPLWRDIMTVGEFDMRQQGNET